jgi:hypothetical protein
MSVPAYACILARFITRSVLERVHYRSKDCINLDEIADTVRPCRQQLEDAADEVLMLLGGLVAVELEEARLALRAHHHHGLDHG